MEFRDQPNSSWEKPPPEDPFPALAAGRPDSGYHSNPAAIAKARAREQDELPKLKEPELTTEEEKVAWWQYAAGYYNAQQDMLRAGWRKCPKVEWPLRAVAIENSTQQDLDYAAGCFDQRDADQLRCPAQQEGR